MSTAIAVCHGEFGRAALYRLDRTIIKHAHREGHLIFYIDEALSSVEVGENQHPLDPAHCVAVSPWEPHSFLQPQGEASICLVLYIKPMWFLEASDTAEYSLMFGTTALPVTPEIADLVKRLTALLLDNDDEAAFDRLLYALTRVCYDLSWARSDSEKSLQCRSRMNDFRIRRSLRAMQEAMADDVDMECLARSVGLSRPHFFKLFRQYMGVTPNVYLNTLRSERAIDDLIRTSKTVTEIAFELGFSSQASFTRFFSSNVGIAPSEYRRVAHVETGAFPMPGKPVRLSGMHPAE